MRALVIHGKWVEKSGEATPCVIVRERAPAGRPFFLSYCESFRELRRRRTGWKVLRKSSDSGNALVCTLRVPDVRSRGDVGKVSFTVSAGRMLAPRPVGGVRTRGGPEVCVASRFRCVSGCFLVRSALGVHAHRRSSLSVGSGLGLGRWRPLGW